MTPIISKTPHPRKRASLARGMQKLSAFVNLGRNVASLLPFPGDLLVVVEIIEAMGAAEATAFIASKPPSVEWAICMMKANRDRLQPGEGSAIVMDVLRGRDALVEE